jgi:hypothetical protein
MPRIKRINSQKKHYFPNERCSKTRMAENPPSNQRTIPMDKIQGFWIAIAHRLPGSPLPEHG